MGCCELGNGPEHGLLSRVWSAAQSQPCEPRRQGGRAAARLRGHLWQPPALSPRRPPALGFGVITKPTKPSFGFLQNRLARGHSAPCADRIGHCSFD